MVLWKTVKLENGRDELRRERGLQGWRRSGMSSYPHMSTVWMNENALLRLFNLFLFPGILWSAFASR